MPDACSCRAGRPVSNSGFLPLVQEASALSSGAGRAFPVTSVTAQGEYLTTSMHVAFHQSVNQENELAADDEHGLQRIAIKYLGWSVGQRKLRKLRLPYAVSQEAVTKPDCSDEQWNKGRELSAVGTAGFRINLPRRAAVSRALRYMDRLFLRAVGEICVTRLHTTSCRNLSWRR